MSTSLLAAPLRLLQGVTGQSMVAADFTCWAPTHLGPRYPRGLFGVIDSGEEPFPNVNDTKEQLDRMRKAKVICVFLWSVAAAGLGTAAYYFRDSIPKPEIIFH